MTTELTLKLDDINFNVLSEMVYEENRLSTFLKNRQWPFLEDCNCTPEKMATAGFYWCGSESQPDLVRCFVCLKDFEGWEPNDIPKDEHKRLSPQCPYVKLGKDDQENCTVKEMMELCQKSLINFIEKVSNTQVEQYTNLAKEISNKLEFLGESNMDVSD